MFSIRQICVHLTLVLSAVCAQTASVLPAHPPTSPAKLDFAFRTNSNGIFLPGQSVILDVILQPLSPNAQALRPQPLFASLKFLSQPELPPITGFNTPINFSTPLSIPFVTPENEGVYEIVLSVNLQPPDNRSGRPFAAIMHNAEEPHKIEVRRQLVVVSPHTAPRPSSSWTLSETRSLLAQNEDSPARRQLLSLTRVAEFSRIADLPKISDLPRPADLLNASPFGRLNSRFLPARPGSSEGISADFADMEDGAEYRWSPHLPSGSELHLDESKEHPGLFALKPGLMSSVQLQVKTGRPYIIEIDYPANVPQSFEVAVVDLQPNREMEFHGKPLKLRRVNVSASIHVAEEIVPDSRTETIGTHQLLFWAESESSELHISNPQADQDALFRSIRISQVSPPGLQSAGRLPKLFEGQAQRKRIGQILGPNALHIQPGKTNWLDAHKKCSRLIDKLHRGGYDGVTLTVLSKHISLYPTTSPSLDYLEMMFQRFNSEELTLIPAIEFNMPIPWLEQMLANHPGSIEEILIGNPSERRYNVLHPEVQQEMGKIVLHLINEFKHHPSFGGVAIILSPESYAQLPFAIYPPDDFIFSQFRRESESELGVQFPDEQYLRQTMPMQQFLEQKNAVRIQFLHGNRTVEEAWIRWRAAKISGFYASLARQIQERRDIPLYLLGGTMLDQPAIQDYCTPTLPRNDTPLRALQLLGFDLQFLSDAESLHFLRPVRIAPVQNHAYRTLNSADAVVHFAPSGAQSGSLPGVQFVHVDHHTPAHAQSRRRFVRQLAQADVLMFMDGGISLPLGQESAMFDLLDTFRRLPPVPFDTFQPADDEQASTQPLTIRYKNMPEGMMMYIVNDASFAVEADFAFSAAMRSTMTELTGHRMIRTFSRNTQTGQHTWRASLLPYDVLAVQISDANAKIESATVQRPSAIYGADGVLKQKIDELDQRVHAARLGVHWKGLTNGDFEKPLDMGGGIVGWQSFGQSLSVQLDQNIVSQGLYSVRLTNKSAEQGTFLSQPLNIPATGRLSVSMFVGVPEDSQALPMSVILTAKHLDKPFYRSVAVEDTLLQALANTASQNGVRWQRLAVPFGRLPTEAFEEVRVGIQYSGQGTVWLDEMTLHQVMFLESEMFELRKMPAVAQKRYSEGRVSDLISQMEGYWVQFLFEHVPAESVRAAVSSPKSPIASESAPRKSPTLYQRVRGWVAL